MLDLLFLLARSKSSSEKGYSTFNTARVRFCKVKLVLDLLQSPQLKSQLCNTGPILSSLYMLRVGVLETGAH